MDFFQFNSKFLFHFVFKDITLYLLSFVLRILVSSTGTNRFFQLFRVNWSISFSQLPAHGFGLHTANHLRGALRAAWKAPLAAPGHCPLQPTRWLPSHGSQWKKPSAPAGPCFPARSGQGERVGLVRRRVRPACRTARRTDLRWETRQRGGVTGSQAGEGRPQLVSPYQTQVHFVTTEILHIYNRNFGF